MYIKQNKKLKYFWRGVLLGELEGELELLMHAQEVVVDAAARAPLVYGVVLDSEGAQVAEECVEVLAHEEVGRKQVDEHTVRLVPLVRLEQQLELAVVLAFVLGAQRLALVHPFAWHAQALDNEALGVRELAARHHVLAQVEAHAGLASTRVCRVHEHEDGPLPQAERVQLRRVVVVQTLHARRAHVLVLHGEQRHGQVPAQAIVELIGGVRERRDDGLDGMVALAVQLDQMIARVVDSVVFALTLIVVCFASVALIARRRGHAVLDVWRHGPRAYLVEHALLVAGQRVVDAVHRQRHVPLICFTHRNDEQSCLLIFI